jgi:catechol 2,3-dioxygenase-like lactoylglutathione lyase family enzyme
VKTKRIDHVVVATPDAAEAAATFRSHFDLIDGSPMPGGAPTLRIGGARIAFVTPQAGTSLAAALASGGEGMAVVCLEVAALAEAEATLRKAGVGFTPETVAGRPALVVDPGAAHGVRLTLIQGPT